MTQNFKTMWVKRKDTKDIQNIKAYRFNSELHKKLFWKNFWINNLKSKKIDWNNQWIVGIGLLILGIILSLIFGV